MIIKDHKPNKEAKPIKGFKHFMDIFKEKKENEEVQNKK